MIQQTYTRPLADRFRPTSDIGESTVWPMHHLHRAASSATPPQTVTQQFCRVGLGRPGWGGLGPLGGPAPAGTRDQGPRRQAARLIDVLKAPTASPPPGGGPQGGPPDGY